MSYLGKGEGSREKKSVLNREKSISKGPGAVGTMASLRNENRPLWLESRCRGMV